MPCSRAKGCCKVPALITCAANFAISVSIFRLTYMIYSAFNSSGDHKKKLLLGETRLKEAGFFMR